MTNEIVEFGYKKTTNTQQWQHAVSKTNEGIIQCLIETEIIGTIINN